ncbi:YfmQ family protein [Mesobacillus maritimus]|uniref:YfmQ family protein n=1 Tax=Mesobacillus maritimus TaxID=1643336 RepID=UPI00203D4CD6|nr:YfmQ family protein [Mesobacillus maritimus]MCM3588386.1 YfmQ family protein [Mesobacillus maritimus]MCM3672020.1 YfmQ family protein [Mesobacillus maritimus]
MTWTVVLTLAIGVVLKLIMSPPSAVVAWGISKFALHPKLNSNDVVITFNGEHLVEDDKTKFIDIFNEATFLKKYEIFPGNEELFLHPKTDVIPFVIHTKSSKNIVTFYVYRYEDHVDVVKQDKKKVVSYRLRADQLLSFTLSTKENRIKAI